MRATLRDEVREFLREHGPSTAGSVAIGIRARRVEVDELLGGGGFRPVQRPDGASPRAVYFGVSEPVPAVLGAKSRAAAMLAVLRDGRKHSREDIFEASGRFFLTNNAASELRASGHDVRQARQGRLVVYWLNQPAVRPAAVETVQGARISGSVAA